MVHLAEQVETELHLNRVSKRTNPGWPCPGIMFPWLFGEGAVPRLIVRRAPSDEGDKD